MAFLITALIRTAQGSATVAMITAVGMLTAFNTPGALSFHPVYLAIVIGCGSKVFAWMNERFLGDMQNERFYTGNNKE